MSRRLDVSSKGGSLALSQVSRSDIPIVARIEMESNAPPWSHSLFRSELDNRFASLLGGYSRSGRLVGFVLYHALGREAHILKFAVRRTLRSRGYGREILAGALERMVGVDIRWVTLEVRESNEGAQRLYRLFGFEPTGVRPRYYSDNQEDAVVMSLDVQNHLQTNPLFPRR